MKNYLSKIYLLVLVIVLSGCASSGINLSTHVTNVELSEPNYTLVAKNVSGTATIKGALGLSYGFGLGASQISLIPISKDRMLYKRAMEDLWSKFEMENGNTENRKLALVNLRYDSQSLNTFLYTKLTVEVIADVVEFEE